MRMMGKYENNTIKITIVMPVYNAGTYLEESLNSIFAQTFQEFELLCIDDASEDEQTGNLLRNFRDQYENMRITRMEHHTGAANARNTGLSKARGKYVIFLDADDIFAPDLLAKMYACICENNADVCVCGYKAFYVKNGKKHFNGKYIPDSSKVFVEPAEDWLLRISTVPWNKLCRTQFLREHKIYFQSLSSSNDVFFSCMVLLHADRRCLIGGIPLIYYRADTGTQISANRNPVNLYRAMMLLQTTEHRKYEKRLILQWSSALLVWEGITELIRCRNEVYGQQFYTLLQEYFANHRVYFQNEVLKTCADHIKNLPYNSKWFMHFKTHLNQIRLMATVLKERLPEKEPLFLWGLGRRGHAFQQFCNEENIELQGVADIAGCNIGGTTEFGNRIIAAEAVLQSTGWIIASNTKIYEYLTAGYTGRKVLDLEEFCPA